MNKDILLLKSISDLELTPTMELYARDRTTAMENFLNDKIDTEFKLQGSFMHGTVIRPFKKGVNKDFDLDVFSLRNIDKNSTTPKEIKSEVGYLINENEVYKDKMLPEDSNCWTLKYAEISPGVSFKLDIVPAINDSSFESKSLSLSHMKTEYDVFMTEKVLENYEWKYTNSLIFGEWFLKISKYHLNEESVDLQRSRFTPEIIERFSKNESSEIIFPDYLFKSNLQRAIQIAKRHRDVYFDRKNDESHKVSSFLITALISDSVKNLSNLLIVEIISEFVIQFNKKAISIMNGDFEILNPIDSNENIISDYSSIDYKKLVSWVQKLEEMISNYDEKEFKRALDSDLDVNVFQKDYLESLTKVEPVKPWRQID